MPGCNPSLSHRTPTGAFASHWWIDHFCMNIGWRSCFPMQSHRWPYVATLLNWTGRCKPLAAAYPKISNPSGCHFKKAKLTGTCPENRPKGIPFCLSSCSLLPQRCACYNITWSFFMAFSSGLHFSSDQNQYIIEKLKSKKNKDRSANDLKSSE